MNVLLYTKCGMEFETLKSIVDNSRLRMRIFAKRVEMIYHPSILHLPVCSFKKSGNSQYEETHKLLVSLSSTFM